MKNKFEIGDKVIIVWGPLPPGVKIGAEGIVADVSPRSNNYVYEVVEIKKFLFFFKRKRLIGWFNEKQLINKI